MIDLPTDEEIKAEVELRMPDLSRVHKSLASLVLKAHRDAIIETRKLINDIHVTEHTPEQIRELKKLFGAKL